MPRLDTVPECVVEPGKTLVEELREYRSLAIEEALGEEVRHCVCALKISLLGRDVEPGEGCFQEMHVRVRASRPAGRAPFDETAMRGIVQRFYELPGGLTKRSHHQLASPQRPTTDRSRAPPDRNEEGQGLCPWTPLRAGP